DGAAVGLRGFYRKDAGWAANVPTVASLAAAFGIERRRREDDVALFSLYGHRDRDACSQQRDDGSVRCGVGVADEIAVTVTQRLQRRRNLALEEQLALLARLRTLSLHRRVEALIVELEPLAKGYLPGEFQRHAE